ncbi:MAG: alpha/beta fold hydrolase [Rivularia sp. (in: cyanobacteria)]
MNQQRNPVLLVHGIWDTAKVFRRMIPYLNERGLKVYDLDLAPNNGTKGLDDLAQQVADKVEATFEKEQPFDLLGFSMGGIVSRYYVQRLSGINRVQRFITLSAPNNGTVIAYFNQGLGCVQMRPNSSLLKDLNSDAQMLSQINFTSIWTPYDMMIVPADSSKMPVGENVVVSAMNHAWMLTDDKSLNAIATALSAPIK